MVLLFFVQSKIFQTQNHWYFYTFCRLAQHTLSIRGPIFKTWHTQSDILIPTLIIHPNSMYNLGTIYDTRSTHRDCWSPSEVVILVLWPVWRHWLEMTRPCDLPETFQEILEMHVLLRSLRGDNWTSVLAAVLYRPLVRPSPEAVQVTEASRPQPALWAAVCGNKR